MSASHPVTTRPPRTSRGGSLSAQLRLLTRAAHVNAEQVFDVSAALADRRSYAALLVRLQGFYRPAEAALQNLAGWAELDPPIDVHARERVGLLHADLQRLGRDRADDEQQMRPPAVRTLAAGLGWLYVLEGSALGGQVIAGRARAALGEELPVSFFGSEGRPTGRNWRDLQHALDEFGAVADPLAVEETIAAATDGFERFSDCMGGGTT